MNELDKRNEVARIEIPEKIKHSDMMDLLVAVGIPISFSIEKQVKMDSAWRNTAGFFINLDEANFDTLVSLHMVIDPKLSPVARWPFVYQQGEPLIIFRAGKPK